MKKILRTFLIRFVPYSRLRKFLKRCVHGLDVRIVIIEDGVERQARLCELRNIVENFRISGSGKNNIIKIGLPYSTKLRFHIIFSKSDNNVIEIGRNLSGIWGIGCYDFNNHVVIGDNVSSSGVNISCIGHTVLIGRDCMFSNSIHIWGDGHSVLDYNTGAVLNKPDRPIVVGDHCWIGERVTLTKNAQLPNDCIVGIASVVTKKFTEEHSVIAGAPAKVVKTGITWHGVSPLKYEDFIKKEQVKNG